MNREILEQKVKEIIGKFDTIYDHTFNNPPSCCRSPSLTQESYKDFLLDIREIAPVSQSTPVVKVISFDEFKSGNVVYSMTNDLKTITFISHKWFGSEPDNQGSLKAFIISNVKTKFFWIDYLCASDDIMDVLPNLLPRIREMVFIVFPGPSIDLYACSGWCSVELMCARQITGANRLDLARELMAAKERKRAVTTQFQKDYPLMFFSAVSGADPVTIIMLLNDLSLDDSKSIIRQTARYLELELKSKIGMNKTLRFGTQFVQRMVEYQD